MPGNEESTSQYRAFEQLGQIVPQELTPHEPAIFPMAGTLYDPADAEQVIGIRAQVPLEITAGDASFMVIDLRSYPENEEGTRRVPIHGRNALIRADALLIDTSEWDPRTGELKGFVGVRANEPFIFGRSDDIAKQRFAFVDSKVSREHFRVELSERGMLGITDLGSLNKTLVTKQATTISSDRMIRIGDRFEGNPRFSPADSLSPNGYLDGYPIIGRNSPQIVGGVYLGGSSREAIKVSEQDPRLDDLYKSLTRKSAVGDLVRRVAKREDRNADVPKEIQEVFELVSSVMHYDGDAVEQLAAKYKGDQIVELGEFVEQGIGVCRHMGLLSGCLIERLIQDGKIDGHVRVERNTIRERANGTHGWATYVTKSGLEIVIDPAQGFVGTKKQALQQSRYWNYYLALAA